MVMSTCHRQATGANAKGGTLKSATLYESLRVTRGKQSSYDLRLLLKEWDRGSKQLRSLILKDFVANHTHSTGPELERELGNGASLFLTRISAWLRLTYLLGTCLRLQIRALQIFVVASSGQRFLAEFLEVGGILTILDILCLNQVSEEDKVEAAGLLTQIAISGRKFKELVCESHGLDRAAQCLSCARTEALQDALRALLVELGIGNIKFQDQICTVLSSLAVSDSAGAQRMAAQTLRTLLPSMLDLQASDLNEAALFMLRSPKLEVQYEGAELLKELLKTKGNQRQLLVGLIASLKPVVDEPLEMGGAGAPVLAMDDQGTEVKGYGNVSQAYTQQAAAAKLLGVIAAVHPELLVTMIELQVVQGLLVAIATTNYLDSQKKAAATLLFLLSKNPSIEMRLSDQLGKQFVDTMLSSPNSFYRNLTTIQLDQLATNTVRFPTDIMHAVDPSDGDQDDDSGTGLRKMVSEMSLEIFNDDTAEPGA